MFPALMGFNDCLPAYLADKSKSHICNGCRAVKTSLLFHLLYNMLQSLFLILIQMQPVQNQHITFCQLRRCKPDRYVIFFGMVFNQVHDTMQASMYCTTMVVRFTEVLSSRSFLIFCHM